MTPTERRQRITGVFERAVKLRPEDRAAFVERECRGDDVLVEELRSLLAVYQDTESMSGGFQPGSQHSATRSMPRKIGRYENRGELGSGGFGHVYSAFDPGVDRVVAIKVLNAPGDPDLVKRFRAEAMTVAKLHHKNIVTVHEFGEENGAPYLVMEFLEGTNVQDIIRKGQLSLHEKLWIMSEVAEGLEYAHSRGVIHRDVKPANIMRLSDGSVKIMDFGIARMAAETSTRLTQTGFVIGSLTYMAPEQFNGISDALTDIFAYGVTFYELLTGRHPFSAPDPGATMFRIMNVEPPPVRSLLPECPEAVERMVSRTLAKNREARYTGLADVVADIRPILADLRRLEAGGLFSKASQLLNTGQLDTAHSTVRKALDLDPYHTEARTLRDRIDQALQRRKTVDQAEGLLDRAERELSAREFLEAGRCLDSVRQMALGDTRINERLEKAYARIERARDAVRLLEIAREGLANEKLTDAFRAVSEVLASDPGNATGQQLLQDIQVRMAAREGQRKLQEEMQRAESLLLIGETDQAFAMLSDLERRMPPCQEIATLRAQVARQMAEEERGRRLAAAIAAAKVLVKDHQFAAAVQRIDEAAAEFGGIPELAALRRHAAEQETARKRLEEIRQLKADAGAWIAGGEYDRAIRALETGVALGDDGELTKLLQSAVAGKAEQEKARAVSGVAEEIRRLRSQGKLEDAFRMAERAIERWGGEPPLPQLLHELAGEREEKERRNRIRDATRRAGAMIGQDRAEEAITLLRQAIQRDGEDADLRNLLANAEKQIRDRSRSFHLDAIRLEVGRLKQGQRWAEACQRIDEALREFPDEPSLASERASVMAAIAAESRERTIVAVLGRIQALQQESRFREAIELVEKSLSELGGDARLVAARRPLAENLAEQQRREYFGSLREQCLLLLNQARFDEAFRLLEGGEVRYPHSREAADLRTQAQSAREAHERKHSIESALARASELIQKGQFEGAVGALEEAHGTYPEVPELGEALARARSLRDEADRKREIEQNAGLIERAIADQDWDRAINRVAAALDRFPKETCLVRLKRNAEEGKRRSEIAEVEASAHQALQAGNATLAGEIIAAARIRWPDEKKIQKLHEEFEFNRADEGVSRARQLLQAGRIDEAGQLAAAALKRWPKLAGAAALVEEIAARKSARAQEQTAAPAEVRSSPRKPWLRLAIWASAGALAIGGSLYWVARPRPKPVEAPKAAGSDLTISQPGSAAPAAVGTAYTQTLRASGGSSPISWALVQGSLPPGLELGHLTGRIEGKPERSGEYPVVAQASDSQGHTAECRLTIIVADAAPPVPPAPKPERAKEKVPEKAVLPTAAPAGQVPRAEKPVEPKPAPACAARAFQLDQYGDSRAGQLTWTGSLAADGRLEIRDLRASSGFVRGDVMPAGVPVRVSVGQEKITILSGPSPDNCWDLRLVLQNSGAPADTVTIKWVVYQP